MWKIQFGINKVEICVGNKAITWNYLELFGIAWELQTLFRHFLKCPMP